MEIIYVIIIFLKQKITFYSLLPNFSIYKVLS